jgi:hypothetical protein
LTPAVDGAPGLFAQSVGGGGGDAGAAANLGASSVGTESTTNATLSLVLGATSGSGGAGGAVSVSHLSGALHTSGIGAAAIFAQSVGGGGGRAGAGAVANGGSVQVGGHGGVSGAGGNVTVTVSHGSIEAGIGHSATAGAVASYGIFAQSVGGGGGIAGNVLFGSPADFGSGLAMNSSGSNSTGTGGTVDVTLASGVSLTTFGNSSVGIFAQSVGGGGGIKGEVTANPTGALIGSNGGSGAAGAVSVTVDGSVTTGGANAHGVFAQAASTTAAASLVEVQVGSGASIAVSGASAHGIFAQSATLTGQLEVTIDGSVQGGAAATSSSLPDGAGVYLVSNAHTSSLSVASGGFLNALSGTAIRVGGSAVLTATNAGTVAGSLFMEASDGSLGLFVNETGGVFGAGDTVEADVINDGTMIITVSSPTGTPVLDDDGVTTALSLAVAPTALTASSSSGSDDTFTTTQVKGDLIQHEGGKLVFDVAFHSGEADRLEIAGAAILDGEVTIKHRSILPNRTVSLLQADGGLTREGLEVTHSALFTHELAQQGNELLVTALDADFTPEEFDLSEHAQAAAAALQEVWDAGGTDEFGAFFPALGAKADAAEALYEEALHALTPRTALDIGVQQWANLQSFADGLLNCPEFAGDGALVIEGECVYARVVGRHSHLQENDGVPGSHANSVLVQGGGQLQIAPDWFLLGSLGYQYSHLEGDGGGATATGNSGYAGVALKWQSGPWLAAAGVSGGYGSFDLERDTDVGGALESSHATQQLWNAGLKLRGAYTFASDPWYVRPSVDLDLIYTHQPAFREEGSEPVNLEYEDASQTTVIGTPAVEFGRRFDLGEDATLRAYLQGGVSVLSDDEWTIDARFRGAPDGLGDFSTSVESGNVVGRVNAGVQLLEAGGLDLRLRYEGSFSGDWTSHAGVLTGALHF